MFEVMTTKLNSESVERLEKILKRKINIDIEKIYVTQDVNQNIIGYIIGKISKDKIGYITDIACGKNEDYSDRIEEALLCMIVDYFRIEKCKSIQFDLKDNIEISKKYENKDMYILFP